MFVCDWCSVPTDTPPFTRMFLDEQFLFCSRDCFDQHYSYGRNLLKYRERHSTQKEGA